MVSRWAQVLPLPPVCPPTERHCSRAPSLEPELFEKKLLVLPDVLSTQHRVQPQGDIQTGLKNKKLRNVAKTEHFFCSVLKPVSNIINVWDKIKPLLTSKMNN